MNTELLTSLESFPIGDEDAVLDFTARLARENGWSLEFTERVEREYRRFLYLAMEAGHPVTPSEEVDQVWHLHLCYTRSYWEDLCGGLLGRPLHHGPTRGGIAEGQRFEGQYAATLASYERVFGEPPPPDVWPAPEVRFAPPTLRWVDTSRTWLLPKPGPLRGRRLHLPSHRLLALTGLVFLVSSGCAGVLDWKGQDFLLLYGSLLPVAALLSYIAPRLIPAGPADAADPGDPCELAFLAGGGTRALDAAVVTLVEAGVAGVSGRRSLKREEPVEVPALAKLPARLHAALPEDRSVNIAQLRRSLRPALASLQSRLRKMGLLLGESQLFVRRLTAALPFLALLLLAGAKMIVGLQREKPIGFLLVGAGLTLIAMILRLRALSRRTAAGQRVLRRRREHLGKLPASEDLPLAVALCGVSALEAAGRRPLAQALRTTSPDTGSSSVGCGMGCGVASSGGGSGCGGGGCGGGGCGGCGGCGG